MARKKTRQKKKTQAKEQAPEQAPAERQREGEIVYKCKMCGGKMRRNSGGQYHPDFLVRDFKCTNCGRETDMIVTRRQQIEI